MRPFIAFFFFFLLEIFGNYEQMLVCFEHALQNSDDSAGVYYDMGVALDNLDSIELAIDHYNAALKLAGNDSQALLNIGVDWGLKGYSDSASYYFEKAAEAGLHTPELYYNIGVIMFESGAYEEAMNNFMKALATDPNCCIAKLQLGNVYEIMGDSGMAKVYFEEFVKTAPYIYLDNIKSVKEKLAKFYKAK